MEYDVSEHFVDPTHVRGPFALDKTDFAARVDLTDLPDDRAIFVRVMFQELSNDRVAIASIVACSNWLIVSTIAGTPNTSSTICCVVRLVERLPIIVSSEREEAEK